MKAKSTKVKSAKAKVTKAKITKVEQIKTFRDACQIEGLDASKVIPDFSGYPEGDRKAMEAHAQLVIIARAANRIANKGKLWTPDWSNGKWDKYYPWFYMGGSSGFQFDGYVDWHSYSNVGSRLCFISRDVATHIGKQFADLYKDYFVI